MVANILVFTVAEAAGAFLAGVIIPAMGSALTVAPVIFSRVVSGCFQRDTDLHGRSALVAVALLLTLALPELPSRTSNTPGAAATGY